MPNNAAGENKLSDSRYFISYLTIVAEVLQHYREYETVDDVVNRIGASYLIEITGDSKIQWLDDAWPLPEGFDQRVFRFKESIYRDGLFEVVFHKDQLVNFRAQLFLRQCTFPDVNEYIDKELRPLLRKNIGDVVFQYDEATNTFRYYNFNGLIVAFRYVPGYLSVSTHITDMDYA